MNGTIYLIGGGEIAEGDTKMIDDDIMHSAPRNAHFLFVGAAAQDSEGYKRAIETVFGDRFTVSTAAKKYGRENALDALTRASVIYLGGGDTELLLERFAEWGFIDPLRDAHRRGVTIAGMSAGAEALSSWYVARGSDGEMDIRCGWGLSEVCVLVHATEDAFVRARRLWHAHKEARRYPLIACGEKAAWCMNDADERKIGNGPVWVEQG